MLVVMIKRVKDIEKLNLSLVSRMTTTMQVLLLYFSLYCSYQWFQHWLLCKHVTTRTKLKRMRKSSQCGNKKAGNLWQTTRGVETNRQQVSMRKQLNGLAVFTSVWVKTKLNWAYTLEILLTLFVSLRWISALLQDKLIRLPLVLKYNNYSLHMHGYLTAVTRVIYAYMKSWKLLLMSPVLHLIKYFVYEVYSCSYTIKYLSYGLSLNFKQFKRWVYRTTTFECTVCVFCVQL